MEQETKRRYFKKISLNQFKEREDILDMISKESIKSGRTEEYAEKRKQEIKSINKQMSEQEEKSTTKAEPKRGTSAGKCPKCGSVLVWRKAKKTDELYRGCTNFAGGCRWNDRSY